MFVASERKSNRLLQSFCSSVVQVATGMQELGGVDRSWESTAVAPQTWTATRPGVHCRLSAGTFFIFQVGGWGEDEGWLRRRMDVSLCDGVFRVTVARLSGVCCICVQASCLDSDDGCSR